MNIAWIFWLSVSGKNDKNEKVNVKTNEHGVKVMTTDTNGTTTIHKNK